MFRLATWFGVVLFVAVVGFGLYAWQVNSRGDRAVERVRTGLDERGLLNQYTEQLKDEDYFGTPDPGTNAAYWLAAMDATPAPGDLPLLSAGIVITTDIEPRQQFHPDMIAALEQVFAEYPQFMQLVEQARQAPPDRFRLTHHLSSPAANLDELGGARAVARWLEERSRLAQIHEDGEAFTQSILATLELSTLLSQEPGLLPALVVGSIEALAYHATIDGLSRISLSADQLDRLIQAFESRRDAVDIVELVGYDLSWTYHNALVDVQNYLRATESRQAWVRRQLEIQYDDWIVADDAPGLAEQLRRDLLLMACPGRYELRLAEDMLTQLEQYNRLEDLNDKPTERWVWIMDAIEAQRDARDEEDDNDDGRRNDPRRMEGNNCVISAQTLIRTQSAMTTATAALRVERYRVEHGDWPTTLAEAHGGDTPLDARGEELRYQRTNEGVIIYNTGDNLADEQGYGQFDADVPDEYFDPDDFALRLYSPELRNSLPPPDHAFEPELEYDADGFPIFDDLDNEVNTED